MCYLLDLKTKHSSNNPKKVICLTPICSGVPVLHADQNTDLHT